MRLAVAVEDIAAALWRLATGYPLKNYSLDAADDKVKTGMYQTASEAIREGLRLLRERDQRLECVRSFPIEKCPCQKSEEPSYTISTVQVFQPRRGGPPGPRQTSPSALYADSMSVLSLAKSTAVVRRKRRVAGSETTLRRTLSLLEYHLLGPAPAPPAPPAVSTVSFSSALASVPENFRVICVPFRSRTTVKATLVYTVYVRGLAYLAAHQGPKPLRNFRRS